MVEVTDRVMQEVDEIGKLPQMQGVKIFDMDNQGEAVKESLSDLLSAGLIGALLAVAVLYLFLRQISTTLIVTASVPFSLMITLGALYFADLSLNILTMMGLMLAVGMLVDNAVVVVESVFRERAKDPDNPIEATYRGVKEVAYRRYRRHGNDDHRFSAHHVRHADRHYGFPDPRIRHHHRCPGRIAAYRANAGAHARRAHPCTNREEPDGRIMRRLTAGYIRLLEWILVKPWKTFGLIVTICAHRRQPAHL